MRRTLNTMLACLPALLLACSGTPTTAATIEAYWDFENGTVGSPDPGTTDNVLDVSTNTNHGTAASATGGGLPTYSGDTWVGGPGSVSLDLEAGQKQYVEVPHDASISFGNNPYTIEGYAKLESLGRKQYLIMKKELNQARTDSYADYIFAVNGDFNDSRADNMVMQLGKGSAGSGSRIFSSDLRITDNDWHYVSVSYDPTAGADRQLRFIRDGVIDYQGTGGFTPGDNTGEVLIGAHMNASDVLDTTFDGKIDELRVSSGRAAPGELLDTRLANSSTRGWWRFEGGSPGGTASGDAGAISDYSGYENHGTANGNPLPVYRNNVPANMLETENVYNDLALELDGDYVLVEPTDTLSFSEDFTIEAFVKLDNPDTPNAFKYAVHRKEIGARDDDQEYGLLAHVGGFSGTHYKNDPQYSVTGQEIALTFGDGSNRHTYVSELKIDDSEWHFISAAFDDDLDMVRFTLDGQLEWVQGADFTRFMSDDAEVAFGGHITPNFGNPVDNTVTMLLDEVRLSGAFVSNGSLLYAIPEPSTGLLAILGGLALAGMSRRRRWL